MTSLTISFEPHHGEPLQATLRRAIVTAIGEGRLTPGQCLPPTRVLARQLGVARNTVAAAYDNLVASGVLNAEARRGVFVAPQTSVALSDVGSVVRPTFDWSGRFRVVPSKQRNIIKPGDWQSYPYPFVYGQVDPTLFPLSDWRACSRDALERSAVNWWAADHATTDDPLLVEQIRRHILPRRGSLARPEEILVTLGAQNGLYLLAQLLFRKGTVVGIEDPGYPDARNIAELTGATVRRLPVDADGLIIGEALDGVDVVIVTPANQCPTMVTMPTERRAALLGWAARANAIIVEDEYESEISGRSLGLASLASMDKEGRVIHLGTFSKVLAPGFRLGFMVGPADLIAEARALRRLVHRSVPLNNQRTAALFIADGHYASLMRRLDAVLGDRRATILQAVETHLPGFETSNAVGGTSLWLKCPAGISGTALVSAAIKRGIVIERGDLFFANPQDGEQFVRLGFSSISLERIEAGIIALAEVAQGIEVKA